MGAPSHRAERLAALASARTARAESGLTSDSAATRPEQRITLVPSRSRFVGSCAHLATILAAILGSATPAFANNSTISAADTAWMIVATALVLMMTVPGLALFYCGMVRKKNVLATMAQSQTIPEALFMLYQMTFAIITVALVAGSVADRMRFSAYLLFSIGWFMFVYVPPAHWVRGGGFLGGRRSFAVNS